MSGKNQRGWQNMRDSTLGNEQGIVEGEVGRAMGDWVTGTEGGTWQDEHCMLYYMLANRTPIKNIHIKKSCWQRNKQNLWFCSLCYTTQKKAELVKIIFTIRI